MYYYFIQMYFTQMYINYHSVLQAENEFLWEFLPWSGTCLVHGDIWFVSLNPEVSWKLLYFSFPEMSFKIRCPGYEPWEFKEIRFLYFLKSNFRLIFIAI